MKGWKIGEDEKDLASKQFIVSSDSDGIPGIIGASFWERGKLGGGL